MQHRAVVGRAYSSLVAKATRQEKSSKSFRVLMDIGPTYAAASIVAAQYRSQRVMEGWLNLGGRFDQSACGARGSGTYGLVPRL